MSVKRMPQCALFEVGGHNFPLVNEAKWCLEIRKLRTVCVNTLCNVLNFVICCSAKSRISYP